MPIIDGSNKFNRATKLQIAEKMAEYDNINSIHSQGIIIKTHEVLVAVNDPNKPIDFLTQKYKIEDDEE